MEKMSLNTIREKFLSYFERNGHLVQPSYPLVPLTDKTLLLINAGMVPLKDYFTGAQVPPSTRMATCQKCIRTNDIDNVGHTSRHASFFEMLGNFSFGDYFKKESIHYGWEFITEDLGISKDKLWVTVYLDDQEAYDIWHQQEGVPEERIIRLGKADNFWEIGTGTGPCGPCSEIYMDRGEAYGCGSPDCKPGCDCDRYVEFWNHVFTQYEKDAQGNYNLLEKKNIDTGMGLERVACLMQGVDSIFDIDTMKHIRDKVTEISGKTYGINPAHDASIRIITDHIRAVTFLVTDGVTPNNEGRGYVLRRLLRRAARHGRLLGIDGAFLYALVDTVIEVSGEAYPELVQRQDYTKKVIAIEEDRFEQTIDQGLSILNGYIAEILESASAEQALVLPGDKAFKLYDTYGFPVDLTKEILKEKNMVVDLEAFDAEMAAQRERARSSRDESTLGWSKDAEGQVQGFTTTFLGYEHLEAEAEVVGILRDGELVQRLIVGEEGIVVLDRTPFYGESGGQTGDTGVILSKGTGQGAEFGAGSELGAGAELIVTDTQKAKSGAFLHTVVLQNGSLAVGDKVTARVTSELRLDIARNHTATHILHKALKEVLGDHVEQAGSLVEADRLRFDFNHFQPVSKEEVARIEALVNEQVFKALPVTVAEMSIDAAKAKGAMALFGEKYGDTVRVVTVGDYSIELCGGTHLKNAAEIGLFKLISEGGVAAGVRRIEATTGRNVYHYLQKVEGLLDQAVTTLKTKREDFLQRAESLLEENKQLQRELSKMKQSQANASLDSLAEKVEIIKDTRVIVGEFAGQDAEVLRNLSDSLAEHSEATLVLIANVDDGKVNFIAKANDKAVKNGVHCGNIVKELAKICGGGGGGRPNMAQAGGKDASQLKAALQALKALI